VLKKKKKMKLKFSYLILIIALAVSSCAAYFSVWGLSQLFAGASLSVIIMASILEVSKIVTTTALHKYWSQLSKTLKIYLTISVGVLMLITSAGIYGFLSNAYQKTANQLEIHEGEVGLLDGKKGIFEKSMLANEKIIESKTKRLDILSNLRSSQEVRLTDAKSYYNKRNVRGDITNADTEIQKLTADIDLLNNNNVILSDSIAKYSVKTLTLKSNSDVAGEIGPLKYISELTGIPMAKVVNYLILLLIFVFDPLAIALILMTNRVFELESSNSTPNIAIDDTTDDITDTTDDTTDEAVIDAVTDAVNEVPIEGNRGYSVNIPKAKVSNTIERIGSNKLVENGNNDKIIFRREGDL
jgi:hypothetical protein